MKTIRIMALAALVAFFASCANKQTTENSEQSTPATTENEQNTVSVSEVYGTYQGVIPAANTTGISTHLTINSDETFVLTRQYQDKNQGTIKNQGRFTFVDNNVIELTDKKGIKTYYRVDNGSVILSDPEGKIADAEFASHYQLRKI